MVGATTVRYVRDWLAETPRDEAQITARRDELRVIAAKPLEDHSYAEVLSAKANCSICGPYIELNITIAISTEG